MNKKRTPLIERLAASIAQSETGCWLWTGSIQSGGYGQIGEGGAKGRRLLVHRLQYELNVGPIPEGMYIDHLCRVRACCNPAHLELVTPQENTLRGVSPNALLHHGGECSQGHDYATHAYFRKQGGWVAYCKACRREKAAATKVATPCR